VSRVATNMGVTRYPLATGLTDGEHEVTVWRRTEARQGPSEFIAFTELSEGGAFLAPPPRAERRIEIIGDSITAGVGIAGTAPCDNVRSNDDNYSAYGSVAARAVRAELVTIAWSDIGMYRNKDQIEASADAMPARYAKILPNDATAPNWDFTRYYPDAVVINLGTNDFDEGDPGQGFVDAYIDFLSAVRRNYSSAYIFCLIQAPESAAAITAAVDAQKAAGDGFIESYDINVTQGGNTACSLQADIPRHAAMGARLAQRLRIRLGW